MYYALMQIPSERVPIEKKSNTQVQRTETREKRSLGEKDTYRTNDASVYFSMKRGLDKTGARVCVARKRNPKASKHAGKQVSGAVWFQQLCTLHRLGVGNKDEATKNT